MKFWILALLTLMPRPAPQGAGGLKYAHADDVERGRRSRPARGGWIEIQFSDWATSDKRPAPQGAGGLKFAIIASLSSMSRPAPQGAGGLKSVLMKRFVIPGASRPARGGWIEIATGSSTRSTRRGPAPQGAGGLKSRMGRKALRCKGSRPARGGWIEISSRPDTLRTAAVPPRKGRVD